MTDQNNIKKNNIASFIGNYDQSSGKAFNPYLVGAKTLDAFRSSEVIGNNRSLSNINEVGSTGFGNIANQLGNAAISTGNPYAILGGFAAKTLGGIVDVFNYSPDFDRIDNSYSNERRNAYDLGGIRSDIKNIDPSKVFGNALKQGGLASLTPFGWFGASRAKNVAKNLKGRAQGQFEMAQGRYNQATENYFETEAADLSQNQRRQDRLARNMFNIRDNFYNF